MEGEMPNGTSATNGLTEDYRLVLPQSRIPTAWYNILADMPVPMPAVLHPGTHQPIGPADLSVLFPMELIKQEVSSDRYIPIPDEVRDIYRLWRPTPLIRAVRLEKALDTPAHIYYKNESVSPSGSHKLNTSVPQAYYNKQEGIQSIATETGAGQWGCALAIAGDMFKMAIDIYMVKISYQQKPYRRSVMQAYGATVTPSPSAHTAAGRMILQRNPNSTGSLGIAISEAVEVAATSGGKTKYSLGSVLNHVLLHQTIIGQEALDGMAEIGEYPDVVIGCVGGGSNFGGIAFPFLQRTLTEGVKTKFLAVEPSSCPSLTRGTYTYDFGDTAGLTPLVKMYPWATTSSRPRSTLAAYAITACPQSSQRWQTPVTSSRAPMARTSVSRRRLCSPATKASSRRRSRATPFERRSMRRWPPRRRARRK
jgi:tryptophan synthase beta chain